MEREVAFATENESGKRASWLGLFVSFDLARHSFRATMLFAITAVLCFSSVRPVHSAANVAHPVPFQTVLRGQRSAIGEPLQIVVRTQAEWDGLWHRHYSGANNPPPSPRIDFDRDLVIGIFLGQKPTGGYDVEITRVERSDSSLYVYYGEKSPPPNAMVTQALTQPFDIVRVVKDGNPEIIFRRDL
jgi:protease stability complex PrcB-like protein